MIRFECPTTGTSVRPSRRDNEDGSDRRDADGGTEIVEQRDPPHATHDVTAAYKTTHAIFTPFIPGNGIIMDMGLREAERR